jgi:tRNA(Ile)-lysidine synthase TilS/MesJ
MRRGHLYSRARALGCNKIALGHHFDDVIETTLMAMLWGGQLQAMPPKLKAANFPSMELIRPLYLVRAAAIEAWRDANVLHFIRCACRFTENTETGEHASKRKEAKEIFKRLDEEAPGTSERFFESLHHLKTESFPTKNALPRE